MILQGWGRVEAESRAMDLTAIMLDMSEWKKHHQDVDIRPWSVAGMQVGTGSHGRRNPEAESAIELEMSQRKSLSSSSSA